ncbi:type II secretion system protein [Rubritalea spongiae]|uniref:Type II secretion system protein n=1 Tax=Rubritalea spongiae TaxID=430797 RepID=A0ABW5E4W1_9BACT
MKNPTHISKSKNGFSLIELLVVIVIIASLAAISYGPIMNTIKDSRIQAGNKLANDLIFAVEQFEQKYDYLPYVETNDGVVIYEDDTLLDLITILMGEEGSSDINPNNLEFFNYQEAENGVDGIAYEPSSRGMPPGLRDPFGQNITLIIDYTGDNKIDLANTPFSGHTDNNGKPLVIRRVAVAGSEGPNEKFYEGTTDKDDPNDDVTSF